MRVLLDENLSPRFRVELPGHEVVTVRYAGWAGLTNGALLHIAEDAGFDVFLTGDKNLAYQQNLTERRICIVVLTAHSWDIIESYLTEIRAAVDAALPGSFQVVECGQFRR